MKQINIEHPYLGESTLAVELGSLLGQPKLLFNNRPVKRVKRFYQIDTEVRTPMQIELKPRYLDTIPRLFINGEKIELARPLKWYEYVWMAMPILLVINGGLLGAFIGFTALKLNATIFRGKDSVVVKFIMTLAINVLAAIIVFAIAFYLQGLLNSN